MSDSAFINVTVQKYKCDTCHKVSDFVGINIIPDVVKSPDEVYDFCVYCIVAKFKEIGIGELEKVE